MRLVWRAVFLSATALAIFLECWGAWDGDPRTDPWTDLIVQYVPDEVTYAVIAALIGWVPYHFIRRYRRRAQARRS